MGSGGIRVAVTGGSGQLGTLVLRRLVDDRKVREVVSLDIRPPLLVSGKLRAIRADVRDPALAGHLAGCDAVIHLAYLVTAHAPRGVYQSVNVEGTRNVLRAVEVARVPHLLYASSVAAYGVVPGHPVPLVEDTPRRPSPEFPYGATKQEVEAVLDAWERDHPDVRVTRMRPSILIGTRIEHAFGTMLARGIVMDVGQAPMPLVWDEDVADAFLLALRKPAGGAFNLSADEPLPAAELARSAGLRHRRVPRAAVVPVAHLMAALSRVLPVRAMDPSWLRVDRVALVPSSRRAREELGWTPRCPTAASVMARYVAAAPGRLDPRLRRFFRLVGVSLRLRKLPGEIAHVTARILLCLTGPGGGDVTLHLEGGRLALRRGALRPPTAVLTLRARVMLDLVTGESDISSAQLTGRLRVEGEPLGTFLLGALLSTYLTQRLAPGWRGGVARLLHRAVIRDPR